MKLQCSGAVAVTLALRASTSAIHAVPPVDVGMCRAAKVLPRLLRASFPLLKADDQAYLKAVYLAPEPRDILSYKKYTDIYDRV